MKKKIFTLRNAVILLVSGLLIIFIIGTDVYLASVKNGLNLYVTAVLPSMLPFFFFSKLLTELDFAQDAGKVLSRPMSKLYRCPPASGYILIMSMLCGYPVGAKLLSELFDGGIIDEKQAAKISAFTSTSGPLFVVGTVGVTMLGNKTYGFVILVSHYLGTLLNGLLYRGKRDKSPAFPLPPSLSSDDILNKSMLNTFLSVGLVGGYVTIFNLIADVFQNVGIIPFFAKILSKIGINARISAGFLTGITEMTKGCLLLSSSGFPPLTILPLCTFLITFGGLGVTFQSLTFLSKTKISPAYYLLTKFTQGIIAAGICAVVILICSPVG